LLCLILVHVSANSTSFLQINVEIFSSIHDFIFFYLNLQSDSKLLLGFPFIGHGNPINNFYISILVSIIQDVPNKSGSLTIVSHAFYVFYKSSC
jgi:hypothetical protein